MTDLGDMGQWVHYDDDIYYLNESIRMLMRNLKLHLDGTYFEEKVHHELMFLDKLLSQFYRALTANQFLHERPQNLRFLNKTKRLFCTLLQSIVNGTSASHLDLSAHFEEYKKTVSRQEQEISEIRSVLFEIVHNEDQNEQVSSEEYKFLLDNSL